MARKSPADPRLLTYLDSLIEKLREQVPAAIKDQDAAAIHQSRVTTRRLAAMLEVMKPILSKSPRHELGSVLRKLRRTLGPLRDLDVMLGHLVKNKSVRFQPATGWMQAKLRRQRDRLRQAAANKADPSKMLARLGAWWGVREEISAASIAIDSLLAESLHLQLDSFAHHADGVTGRRVLEDSAAELKDPHQLRIAGKALRYTLEMAVESGHKLPVSVTRSFKKMQDALGLWHDDVVLAECVMSLSLDERLAHHDAPLQSNLLEMARSFLARASKELDRFGKIWKEHGDELAGIIRQHFPLTTAVASPVAAAPVIDPASITAPQMDPDLFGSVKSADDPEESAPTGPSPV